MTASRLLFPALRWKDGAFDSGRGKGVAREAAGFGGFIVFGGPAEAVRDLTADLRDRAPHPLVFGADLERGAGQQFAGCTPLPPAAALASLDDLGVLRRAGELTAREATALGIRWIYAPVADLAHEPDNPIVGTRAFGAEPEAVSRAVAAWIGGCEAGGGIACVKHFPGHGRTTTDSHLELPVVGADEAELGADLAPFEAAVRAGVPSVMTAHVAYPVLDPSGAPATRSRAIVSELLRGRMGFRGVVVTDALIMGGAGSDGAERAAVEALAAGVDAMLYPEDPAAVAAAIEDALDRGELAPDAVRVASDRLERMIAREGSGGAGPDAAGPRAGWGRDEDRAWAREIALRTVRWVRGGPSVEARVGSQSRRVELRVVDDDVGGPYPVPDRSGFGRALRERGVEVAADGGAPRRLAAIYADVRGWKARSGLSEDSRRAVAEAAVGHDDVTFVLFGPPRLAEGLPPDGPVMCAWGGEPLMQEAAGRALAGV